MFRISKLLALLIALCTTNANLAPRANAKVIDLGRRRELFVDNFLIEQRDHVNLVLNRPRDEGIVLKFDRPWEGQFCGYATVLKEKNKYQLYYRGRPEAGADGDTGEVYCYAESTDGVHWTKPDFELFEVAGHKVNNVILADAAPVTHNFSPMLDGRPGVPADQRYKAIGGTMTSGLLAWKSADGIHWKQLYDQPILSKEMVPYSYMFDSQNLTFWSVTENIYLCYLFD